MSFFKSEEIQDLKEKFESQEQILKQCREHNESFLIENSILKDITAALSRVGTLDQALHQTLDVLSLHIKAQYFGIFDLDEKGENFMYRQGKGYHFETPVILVRKASLMGRSVDENCVLWEPESNKNVQYALLSQGIAEHNLLCAPLLLLNKPIGAIRIANIEPASISAAKNVLESVTLLLAAAGERLLFWEEGEKNKHAIELLRVIGNSLEHSFDEEEIFKKVGEEIPVLFPCSTCFIFILDPDQKPKIVFSWPKENGTADEPLKAEECIRHLLSDHPGACCLEKVPAEYACVNKVPFEPSLMMTTFKIRGKQQGGILLLSPEEESYSKTELGLLQMAATQVSLTLERAMHFHEQEESLRKDPLTHLWNHRIFQERIQEEMTRAKRYGKILSLMMFDIDHFKEYNHTRGYSTGDCLLLELAKIVVTDVRQIDKVFRFGGDEICAILPETKGEDAVVIAKRIRSRTERVDHTSFKNITITIGIVQSRENENPEDLIARLQTIIQKSQAKESNQTILG